MSKTNDLLTAEEVADAVKVLSAERILELAKAGYMPHLEIDGKLFFEKRAVKKYIRDNTIVRGPVKVPVLLQVTEDTSVIRAPKQLVSLKRDLKRLPSSCYTSAIYFLLSKGEVVYVGQSIGVARRIASHFGEKLFDDVVYYECPRDELDIHEAALIRHFRPVYNYGCPTAMYSTDHVTLRALGFEAKEMTWLEKARIDKELTANKKRHGDKKKRCDRICHNVPPSTDTNSYQQQ